MGVVYEAVDADRDARVALKTLQQLDDAGAVLRFKREFRALQDLNHPNLIHLGELCHDAGHWFFTMELLDGADFIAYVRSSGDAWLHQSDEPTALGRTFTDGAAARIDAPTEESPHAGVPRLSNPTPLDETRLRRALLQLARGLEALHAAGKVHRDIKPSNIRVTSSGRLVLLDFGVVGEQLVLGSDAGVVVGTAAYMAPEQAQGALATPAADWYAVGVVLYEALTGGLPFWGPHYQVVAMKAAHTPTPPRSIAPDLPADLDALCLALLAPEPRDRPDGAEVLRRLGAAPTDARRGAGSLVGRRRELGELTDAFEATASGRAVTVVVEGESGVGKTALVGAFTSSWVIAGEDALVLSGRCHERELVPYRALDGVIDALSHALVALDDETRRALYSDDAGLLALAFPVLRRVSGIESSTGEVVNPHEQRARTFTALRELLRRLAGRRRTVIVIDDLQWADADSLALLEEVLRLPAAPAMLLVCTLRPVEGRGDASAALPGEVRRLALGRLPPEEGAELAQLLLLQAGAGGAASAAIAEEAGGHPLFIDELVRHALAGGDPQKETQPLRVEEALWQRLSALDRDDRGLVMLVAVAGAPLAQDVAAWAAGLPPDELGLRAATLRAQHFVRTSGGRGRDTIEPFHDRVRAAVLAHLPEPARRAIHRRLADALESAGADPEALAVHWQGAGEPGRAARWAIAAAAQAADKLAFDRAARLYALALTLGAPNAGELEARRGEALANIGRGQAAAEAFLAAAGHASGDDALALRHRAAEQLLFCGHVDDGLAVLAPVFAALGLGLSATPRRALLRFLYRRARLSLRGMQYRERPSTEVARRDLLRIDVCWTLAMGLSNTDVMRGAEAQAEHLRLALDAGEPYRLSRALATEAGYLGIRAKTRPRAEALLAQAEALADRIANPHAQALALAVRGMIAHLSADYRRAYDFCSRAEAELRTRCVGATCELDQAQLFAMYALTYLGEYNELGRLLPLRVREALERGDRYAATNLRIRVGHLLALAEDDPARARRDTHEAIAEWSRLGFQQPHLFALFADTDVDIYEERPRDGFDRVQRAWPEVMGSLLMRIEVFKMTMHALRGRAALATAERTRDPEERREMIAAARVDAAGLRRLQVANAEPIAQLFEAAVHSLEGRLDEALRVAAEAEARFDAIGMVTVSVLMERRRGEMLGGDAGQARISAADEDMRRRGVRNPRQMTYCFAPGFVGR
jgi:hypothetical protein